MIICRRCLLNITHTVRSDFSMCSLLKRLTSPRSEHRATATPISSRRSWQAICQQTPPPPFLTVNILPILKGQR